MGLLLKRKHICKRVIVSSCLRICFICLLKLRDYHQCQHRTVLYRRSCIRNVKVKHEELENATKCHCDNMLGKNFNNIVISCVSMGLQSHSRDRIPIIPDRQLRKVSFDIQHSLSSSSLHARVQTLL